MSLTQLRLGLGHRAHPTVHETTEVTTFPSLLILFLRGEQDGLTKTLLVILYDKSHSA